jgi:hypothetical protein
MNALKLLHTRTSSRPPAGGDEHAPESEGAPFADDATRTPPASHQRLRRATPRPSLYPGANENAGEAWKHSLIDGIWLTVHGSRPPTDAEWQSHVNEMLGSIDRVRAVLILTEGPSPDARQRAILGAMPELLALPRAVVTGSAMARGAATAVQWLGGEIRSFEPDELDDALGYLVAGAATGDELKRRASQLKAELSRTKPE